MSAPKPLKAMSLRDSLAKTVRLLTKQGVEVQFRGHQPFVQARGNKVTRLVLPELNDNASPELIEAIQGFLDHEVGHIFYTPFAKAEAFAAGNRVRHGLANIIEDIRLEKLLPRDLPGTKENLERMYDSVIDEFFGPSALKAKEPGVEKSEAFSCVMVVAMRALAGQKAFQTYMDNNDLWPYFMPLISKIPDVSRRLRELETYKDVTSLVEDILEAMNPPSQDGDKGDKEGDASSDGDAGDGNSADKSDDSGGRGHGDGEGTDDEKGDEEDSGSCKGGPGDDNGDADGDGDADSDDGKSIKGKNADDNADDGDASSDRNFDGSEDSNSGKEGGRNRNLQEALSLLEPTSRRALFLYNKKCQKVSQIAENLNKTEEETVDLLAAARKRLRELLNGGN